MLEKKSFQNMIIRLHQTHPPILILISPLYCITDKSVFRFKILIIKLSSQNAISITVSVPIALTKISEDIVIIIIMSCSPLYHYHH